MTGYKQYNTYRNQWEYFESKSQGYQIQQPQSSVDINLAERTLNSKQARYDKNLARLKVEISDSMRLIQEKAKDNGYSYEYGRNVVEMYKTQYANKILNGNYDLSSDSVLGSLIKFSADGCIKLIIEKLP
jgi:hypothetical protein